MFCAFPAANAFTAPAPRQLHSPEGGGSMGCHV